MNGQQVVPYRPSSAVLAAAEIAKRVAERKRQRTLQELVDLNPVAAMAQMFVLLADPGDDLDFAYKEWDDYRSGFFTDTEESGQEVKIKIKKAKKH